MWQEYMIQFAFHDRIGMDFRHAFLRGIDMEIFAEGCGIFPAIFLVKPQFVLLGKCFPAVFFGSMR